MTLKLLCTSDWHGTLPDGIHEVIEEEKPDALLYAGDLTPHGFDPGSLQEAAEGLASLGIPVYIVAGNMDDPEYLKTLDSEHDDLHFLGMEKVELNGYSLVGMMDFSFPLVFNFDELMGELYRSLVEDLDSKKTILLNHIPPKNTDTDFATEWGFEEHAGDMALREVVDEFQPALVVCGHIHEAQGTDEVGETVIVNAAEVLTLVNLEEGKKPDIRIIE